MKRNRIVRSLRWGFTLLEILIVLVILSVLAGLAVPSYLDTVERMRASEAMEHLLEVHSAMHRRFIQTGSFSGATLSVLGGTNLDFNPNETAAGSSRIFNYSFSSGPTASAFVARARRIPDVGCGAFTPTYDVFINESGVFTHS